MVDVTTSIVIKCPWNRVFEYASNPDNAPKWYVNIKSVQWLTPKPLKFGSKIKFKAQFLGKQLEYTYEIVEFKPESKLVMRTSQGPFPMETTYTWEEIDKKTTRMTLRNKGKSSGVSKLFVPFMSFAIKRANMKDLRLLKEIMEK